VASFWSRDVKIYFDKYDLGTATTRWAIALEVQTLDPTTFEDAGDRVVAGLRSDQFEWTGLFDDSASIDEVMGSLLGSGNKALSVVIGSGVGSVAYGATAQMYGGRNPIGHTDLVRAEMNTRPDQAFDVCRVMAPRTTGTASTNFGTLDNLALTTAGGTMYTHMFLMTGSLGTGSGTLRVEDSVDGTTWAVFTTQLYTTAGADKVVASGTLNRRTRAAYSSTTAGTASYSIIFNRG